MELINWEILWLKDFGGVSLRRLWGTWRRWWWIIKWLYFSFPLPPLLLCSCEGQKESCVVCKQSISVTFGYLFLHSLIYWFIYRLKPRCIYRMILVEDNFLDICSFIPQFIGLSIVWNQDVFIRSF